MVAHGFDADEQFFGDLPVGLATADQPQHFYLPLGQPVWVKRALGWLGFGLLANGGYPSHLRPHAQFRGDGQCLVK